MLLPIRCWERDFVPLIVSENEIIPVSNQATELPNLIHVFSGRKHVSSFADCFTGMVSFFVVYWLLPYSYGETEHGKEENFSESDICGMLEQPVGWILSPELLQASKMTVFHRTVGREVYLPFQLLWKKGRQFVLCHAKPD